MLYLKEIVNNKETTYADFKAQLETQNRANGGNFTTVVNNATTTLKTNAINKIESTVASDETITPDKIITYTVKLDGKHKDSLENDLGYVKFCFWMKDKEKNDITLEVGTGKAAKADNTKRNAIKILNKNSLGTVGYKTDFLALKEGENLTENIAKHSYYYAVVNVNKEKKEVTLQIKFSKWLDTYKICVEAYLLGDTIKADGGKKAGVSGNTTASRTVKANPEIIASYWLNAAGKKIMHAGYKQDIYLYLKTLGLKDKEVKVNVYDKDYYPNPNQPTIYYGRTSKDDIIEWKNNTIKIDEREVFKQFKVGDKVRYKNASEDEDQEYKTAYDKIINNGDYLTEIDFSEKYESPLQLYVHFPDWKKLKLSNDNEYAKLTLTTKEQISDAFFAEVEKENVQADAPNKAIYYKDKKTGKQKKSTKTKVPITSVKYYKKLANGVLGQKVQLVAACANLEDKKVFFKIYEKEKLLVEKDTEIGVIQEGKEVTKIEATVQNGYAVAEIELQHCKEHIDNKDWLGKLKNGFSDTEGKTANLFIKVTCKGDVVHEKEFLKDSCYEMIGNNWHEPIKNPQRNKYNYYGDEKPKSSAFGKVRSSETKYHQGLDIFAVPGTSIYACLDGEIVEKRFSSSVGNVITIEIDEKKGVFNRKIKSNYSFDFPSTGSKGEKEKGASFDLNDNSKIYVRHYHLSKVNVKVGDKVKVGSVIGETGVTGNAHLTKAPHLHLEILDTTEYTYELKDKINPAYFVELKTINDSIQDESVKYKYNKNGTKKKI